MDGWMDGWLKNMDCQMGKNEKQMDGWLDIKKI